MDFSLKLQVRSDPRLLGVVRNAIRQFALVCGFPEDQSESLTLAVEEALTNVIRHAYENRNDQMIELTCLELERGIEFVLIDRGRPPDLAKVCGRPLGLLQPGGLGTHIIREVMDRVNYEASPEGNVLRLVKYREGC